MMYGAIAGDMAGSRFEFTRRGIPETFELFTDKSIFTDDTVMSIAVAEALLEKEGSNDEEIKAAMSESMRRWGNRYPDAGYGGMFYRWLTGVIKGPYGSYGNGSAMRVSSIGWLYDTLEETEHMAALSAEITHNHPEGIKGAKAIAIAIYMARNKASKNEIRDYLEKAAGYDLSIPYKEIRAKQIRSATCQDTVPSALIAFLEGNDFEDIIRKAVLCGGDTDTIAAMAGSIAEAYYGISDSIVQECEKRLPEEMKEVIARFKERIQR